MVFKVPFFRHEDFRLRAEDFLSKYHPSRKIPVPIEEIVDLRLNIDIVPMPATRYRFSLAHEIGHRELHADLFGQFKFSDITSWKRFMTDTIPLEQYRYMEFHANSFAGLILVPAAELRTKFLISLCPPKKVGLILTNRELGRVSMWKSKLQGSLKSPQR